MFKTYVNPSTDRTLMRPAGEEDTETVENHSSILLLVILLLAIAMTVYVIIRNREDDENA